jgi:diaminohydroxyphosphoribosylaminopyrimidine deaminase/5-amino-6-(5-phosphoribosylamino)uracil reductase
MVGCVIVRQGVVVGQGYHTVAGAPHAEAEALRAAGRDAAGATAYITLEPCSHHGRTPPCADALTAAGITRVVAAMQDPNPKVSGKGFLRLKQAGILVETGVMEEEARRLNADFIHFHTHKTPRITLKTASSLDGRIATRTGESRWITGEQARTDVHRTRARTSAVLVGIGTVLADNPDLSVRRVHTLRQPLRAVLDSRLRIPETSRLVSTAAQAPVVVFCRSDADEAKRIRLQQYGVHVVSVGTAADGRIALPEVLTQLARMEVTGVLVEGGAAVHAAFLTQGLAHSLRWYLSPTLIGGDGIPAVGGLGAAAMEEALRLQAPYVQRFGKDLCLTFNLQP